MHGLDAFIFALGGTVVFGLFLQPFLKVYVPRKQDHGSVRAPVLFVVCMLLTFGLTASQQAGGQLLVAAVVIASIALPSYALIQKDAHKHPLVDAVRKHLARDEPPTKQDIDVLLSASRAMAHKGSNETAAGRIELESLKDMFEEVTGRVVEPAQHTAEAYLRVLESEVYGHILSHEGRPVPASEIETLGDPDIDAARKLATVQRKLRQLPALLVRQTLDEQTAVMDSMTGVHDARDRLDTAVGRSQKRAEQIEQARQPSTPPVSPTKKLLTILKNDRVFRELKEARAALDEKVAEGMLTKSEADTLYDDLRDDVFAKLTPEA